MQNSLIDISRKACFEQAGYALSELEGMPVSQARNMVDV